MKSIKILLVEDNPLVQKVATTILQSCYCEVDLAKDGQTALDKIHQHIYDLIFMDIGLPDTDGHTVTMKIREFEKDIRHTPIIALTAHASETERAEGLKAGMDDYFAKPLTLTLAKQILQQYVL